MLYRSTRGDAETLTFSQAVMTGLARDGGLVIPQTYPQVADRLAAWQSLDYATLAGEILQLFADDIPAADLRRIIARSYATFDDPAVAPLVTAGELQILELWHGPTLAFKDIALQFLGNLFEYLLDKQGGELNVVAATSGDTGSAAIHGLRGRQHQRIFVLHPHGRVSPAQALQMTTVTDANVFNLAIDGTFDDCQNIVKALFRDLPFRDACHLGAVNSINWARVVAQVVYYFYAGLRAMAASGASEVSFSVPTGNFGNVFAGYVAWRMGLPIRRLVLATNENDILARFFSTGSYRLGDVVPTLSPSMDIQIASNFERYLFHLAGDDAATLRRWMADFAASGELTLPRDNQAAPAAPIVAGRGDTATTLATIARYYQDYGYLLDPHSAVGVAIGEQYREPGIPMVALSTAHPAKFPDAIARALGREGLASHPTITALQDKPQRLTRMAADENAIGDFIRRKVLGQ